MFLTIDIIERLFLFAVTCDFINYVKLTQINKYWRERLIRDFEWVWVCKLNEVKEENFYNRIKNNYNDRFAEDYQHSNYKSKTILEVAMKYENYAVISYITARMKNHCINAVFNNLVNSPRVKTEVLDYIAIKNYIIVDKNDIIRCTSKRFRWALRSCNLLSLTPYDILKSICYSVNLPKLKIWIKAKIVLQSSLTESIFCHFARSNQWQMFELLLIHYPLHSEKFILEIAAENLCVSIIEVLLKHNIFTIDEYFWEIRQYPCYKHLFLYHPDGIKYLMNNQEMLNNTEYISQYISQVRLEIKPSDFNFVYWAIQQGNLNLTSMLLRRVEKSFTITNALIESQLGNQEMLDLLLRYKFAKK
jgi:hypothetical protein